MSHVSLILHEYSMFENSFQSSSKNVSLPSEASSKLPKPNPQRLRASCDGCYLSKVKCTKETPSCSRCVNHRVRCRYSPSQRAGKPKRPREDQHAREGAKTKATSAAKFPSSPAPCEATLHSPPYSWNLNFDPSIASQSSGAKLEDQISMMWQETCPASNSQNGLLITTSNHDSGLSSPSDSLSTVGSDYLNVSQPPSAAPATIGEHSHHPQPQFPFSHEPIPLQDELAQLFPPNQDKPPVPVNPSPPDSCTCVTTTFDILRTLHDQCSNFAFDKVLAANNSAVSSISTILSCPCIKDLTSIMTLAVALTKIMSHYQSIGRPPPTTDSTFRGSDNLTSPSSNALGSYNVEGADEEQIKLQVILSELRVMDGLMAKFKERFGAWPVMHEARVYGELVTYLRKRLRDIVEGLQLDLQTVHQTMLLMS